MKKIILAVIVLLMGCATVTAQTFVKGDMDDNGILDISDVSKLISTVLGEKSIEYLDVNKVDNSLIQGHWFPSKSNYITFNADSTTDYLGDYKYEYMPYKSQIILYNNDGNVAKVVTVLKLTSELMILTQDGTTFTTYYRKQPVTNIALSDTILLLHEGSSKTITATMLPSDSYNPTLSWSSSNESVAKVTSEGMIQAMTNGKATITATACDGSGVSAACNVMVYPSDVKIYTVNGVSFAMIPVSGGTFQMGATEEQGSDADSTERPVHSVTLGNYYIGETEVSQALWYAVMKAKPSSSGPSWTDTLGLGDNHPAYYISYTDCQKFITKLNSLTGETFQMPSEAEWEYAARGGKNSHGYKYSGSNEIDKVAWYYENSFVKGVGDPDYGNHVLATKAPNELGLYDMTGNVCEFCSDWYGDYSEAAQTNPKGPNTGTYRVVRGGAWCSGHSCRVSARNLVNPTEPHSYLGLRLVQQPAVQSVTAIQLSDTILVLDLNSSQTLTAKVIPSDADNPTYTWSSSNESVATVTSDGLVQTLAYGKTTITATANDGSGIMGKCEVTVKALPKDGKTTYVVNGVTFNMISVEGGTFQMGATSATDSQAQSDESPVHSVTLSNFTIGETEVTQALWYTVMGAKPSSGYKWSSASGLGNNYPAYYLSWEECQEFISKLNTLTGENFRMPTEAEWEYAARGGTKSKGYIYAGSNTPSAVSWYMSNSGNSSHVVATKTPNELNLYDMSGNVWEWCSDWYGNYSSNAQTNPTGPETGTVRVSRGGGWTNTTLGGRVADRLSKSPTGHDDVMGLRLVR